MSPYYKKILTIILLSNCILSHGMQHKIGEYKLERDFLLREYLILGYNKHSDAYVNERPDPMLSDDFFSVYIHSPYSFLTKTSKQIVSTLVINGLLVNATKLNSTTNSFISVGASLGMNYIWPFLKRKSSLDSPISPLCFPTEIEEHANTSKTINVDFKSYRALEKNAYKNQYSFLTNLLRKKEFKNIKDDKNITPLGIFGILYKKGLPSDVIFQITDFSGITELSKERGKLKNLSFEENKITIPEHYYSELQKYNLKVTEKDIISLLRFIPCNLEKSNKDNFVFIIDDKECSYSTQQASTKPIAKVISDYCMWTKLLFKGYIRCDNPQKGRQLYKPTNLHGPTLRLLPIEKVYNNDTMLEFLQKHTNTFNTQLSDYLTKVEEPHSSI